MSDLLTLVLEHYDRTGDVLRIEIEYDGIWHVAVTLDTDPNREELANGDGEHLDAAVDALIRNYATGYGRTQP